MDTLIDGINSPEQGGGVDGGGKKGEGEEEGVRMEKE